MLLHKIADVKEVNDTSNNQILNSLTNEFKVLSVEKHEKNKYLFSNKLNDQFQQFLRRNLCAN